MNTRIADAPSERGRAVDGGGARGHGHSDHPHDPGFCGEERMAGDPRAVVDDLVGYSTGSIVALLTDEPASVPIHLTGLRGMADANGSDPLADRPEVLAAAIGHARLERVHGDHVWTAGTLSACSPWPGEVHTSRKARLMGAVREPIVDRVRSPR